METLEFLGGKYRKTEQIVPGPVQTFRARESGTDRDVFVHRVSTTEEPAEQMALLRMLTTVLLRSAEARRLVLDFGDEQGFWYVVTGSEPRCLVLREWLQFELNRADSGSAPENQPSASAPSIVSAPPKPESFKPETLKPEAKPEPAKPETAPGDFTKLFQTSRPPNPSAPSASTPSAPSPLPEKAADNPAPPIQAEPGEFTRVFQSLKPQPVQPLPASAPDAPPPRKEEEGDFTRFFQSGSSSGSAKTPSNPDVKRSHDRPSRAGFVQRPNTPMPPLPPKSAEPGEFTRIFSHPGAEARKQDDVFADLPIPPATPRDVFKNGGDVLLPKVQEAREPGEYTRIFGGATVPPPVEQAPPITPKPPAHAAPDDPLQGTRHFAPAPPAPPPVQRGPSEYTMVIQGNRPLQEAGVANPSPAAGPPAAEPPAAAGVPSLPKVPPVPQVPQVKAPAIPKPPVPAQVKMPAAPGNKKLVVFFTILAVLAVILVLLVVLITVKK